MFEQIKAIVGRSVAAKQALLADEGLLRRIEAAAQACIAAFERDGKLLFCGNGGSAADAQHLAAEFSGRFYLDRPPLFAEALHVNTSFLTAAANDYGYDEAFARLVGAFGREGDILFALSTSGNSLNIIKAAAAARSQGMTVIAMTGQPGGRLAENCALLLNAPATDTPRIQECHILIGHIICELVEHALFGEGR